MHQRRAFTLSELLVVLTTTAVLLGVALGIVSALLRTEQTGREQGQQAVVLDRLAAQFRADAHAAGRPGRDDPAQHGGWRFDLGAGRAAAYRVTAQAVEREEMAAGQPLRRETYPLPPGCTVRHQLSDDRGLASLIVAAGEADAAWRHELRIEAAVGLDRRFVGAESGDR